MSGDFTATGACSTLENRSKLGGKQEMMANQTACILSLHAVTLCTNQQPLLHIAWRG